MMMNLGELLHRGIDIFAASISLSTFRDQIYYELITAQNSNQKLFLKVTVPTVSVFKYNGKSSNIIFQNNGMVPKPSIALFIIFYLVILLFV